MQQSVDTPHQISIPNTCTSQLVGGMYLVTSNTYLGVMVSARQLRSQVAGTGSIGHEELCKLVSKQVKINVRAFGSQIF